MKHATPQDLTRSGHTASHGLHDLMARLRDAGEPYVLATVVRTISVTAAKAGAKAIIGPSGTITAGWVGGGCARSAVLKAAAAALMDGQTRLVSIQPEDLLAELGVAAGDERDGVRFARNMCPSQGTMDIFIEPVLPRPELVIFGASPVAVALSELAPGLGYTVTACAPGVDLDCFPPSTVTVPSYGDLAEAEGARYSVVATQGQGDLAGLKAALIATTGPVAFVGSRRKMGSLREKLIAEGVSPEAIDRVKAPAGLDIGAITPEEIALSILAEAVARRRKGQRDVETDN